METERLTTLFFRLAQKYDWGETKDISFDEERILFAVVSAAGFEPKRIIVEKLFEHYFDPGNPPINMVFPINAFCPYEVIGQNDEPNPMATGWLNQLLFLASQKPINKEGAIKMIAHQIQQSIPLKPIPLTAEGDLLLEIQPKQTILPFDFFILHKNEDEELSYGVVGIHDCCGNFLNRVQSSRTHDALFCKTWGLRVPFLRKIVTFGDLRKEITARLAQP
jgi:hypothetical protein